MMEKRVAGTLEKLYHYTDKRALAEIQKTGLKKDSEKGEEVNALGEIIPDPIGGIIRESIYFFGEKSSMRGMGATTFEGYVGVYLEDLDVNCLYVADLSKSDNAIESALYMMDGIGAENECIPDLLEYAKTFVPYSVYIDNEIHYEEPEFIYTKDVPANVCHIETLNVPE